MTVGEESEPGVGEFGDETPVGALSEDRQWQWDGETWQPNEDAVGADPSGTVGPGEVPDQGQWIWDGSQWQPVVG
jgi:hypothetical protein